MKSCFFSPSFLIKNCALSGLCNITLFFCTALGKNSACLAVCSTTPRAKRNVMRASICISFPLYSIDGSPLTDTTTFGGRMAAVKIAIKLFLPRNDKITSGLYAFQISRSALYLTQKFLILPPVSNDSSGSEYTRRISGGRLYSVSFLYWVTRITSYFCS